MSAEELGKREFGHKLLKLWDEAVSKGIALPHPRPAWIEQLNRVHTKPHTLRYPIGFHISVLPDQAEMVLGLEHLVSMVNATVS